MSFDLSRIRFDARQDFLGVIQQQGRVQLDADWNEWVAQLARRLQAGSLDTFNGSVVPRTTAEGFRIEANGGTFTIGVGRIYVDGLLAENHGGAPLAWSAPLAELTGTTPLAYTAQPYYPNPPALPAGGPHLVYVDVWQREVGALEVPDLVEKAVGVETTGRLQTVWQVKVLPNVGPITAATPDDQIPGWPAATAPSAGRLTTATGLLNFEPNPGTITPAAGYRGRENQLYRVEVHTGGALGTATFKWSRDNATVASAVTHINPARTRITVDSLGRDDVLGFHDGDWVEVTDDWRELHNLPGELRRIRVAGGVDTAARTLEFETALTAGLFPTNGQQATDAARHTRVRRWDQAGAVRREDGTAVQNLDATGAGGIQIPAAGTRLFLEHGILVEFSLAPAGGQFRSGDYWVFAARSVDASIEPLQAAPPKGIHHHYARLARVTFPGDETDLRTLWPPQVEGEGCDCTVCVSAEGHNSGEATLQQAIDAVKDIGGTVCLGIGRYDLAEPLDLTGARSLRLRGQGWGTLLVSAAPGRVIAIADGRGVTVENLTVIGSAVGAGITAMIEARNTIDFTAERVNVLGLAAGDGTSAALGLAGNVLGATVRRCALVAERGLSRVASGDRDHLLSAELRVDDNLFFCSQRAVSLDGVSLHFGVTRIEGNLMLNGNQPAIVAQGAVLGGSSFDIEGNVVLSAGGGILAGVDNLRIVDNDLTGQGERSGDGIAIAGGLDPGTIDRLVIRGNRLRGFDANGVSIARALVGAEITGNTLEDIGLAALVMGEGARAGHLAFSANQCRRLGLAAGVEGSAYAAVQWARVEHGVVSDNVLAEIARSAIVSPGIDAILAVGVGQLRVTGNQIHALGPDRGGGEIQAIHIVPPFDRVVVDHNFVDRRAADGSGGENAEEAAWRALRVLLAPSGGLRRFTTLHAVSAGELNWVMTGSQAVLLVRRGGDVEVESNQLRAHASNVPLTLCAGVDHCLFTSNRVESVLSRAKEAQLGQLAGRTLSATHNRLIGVSDLPTLQLLPSTERAIVIGNTATGPIQVQGSAVPKDLSLTNIFGT